MKNFAAAVIIIIYLTKAGLGQTDSLKNSVYLELGGTGGLYSIGYERSLPIKKTCGINLAVGFSVIIFDRITYVLPIQLKVYHKVKKFTFETGIGLTPYHYSYLHPDYWMDGDMTRTYSRPAGGMILLGIAGCKYALFKNRFYAGIAFTPMFLDFRRHPIYPHYYDFMPWGAIQFGYKF